MTSAEVGWMYILDKTQFIVVSLTTGFQLYTRSAGVTFFILGALSCSLSVKLFKKMLKQPRPVGKSKKITYGMPSTHSATMTYYATYISAACLYLPLHKSLSFSRQDLSGIVSRLPIAIIVPWTSLVVMSRVWLGYHNWKQVTVGCAYGASFAALWFALWTRGRFNTLGNQAEVLFENMLSLWLERGLGFYDGDAL